MAIHNTKSLLLGVTYKVNSPQCQAIERRQCNGRSCNIPAVYFVWVVVEARYTLGAIDYHPCFLGHIILERKEPDHEEMALASIFDQLEACVFTEVIQLLDDWWVPVRLDYRFDE